MSIEEDKQLFLRPADERTLLSYCFQSTDYLYDLATKVSEKDFLAKEHQMLFMTMNGLLRTGVNKIDMTMVINHAQGGDIIDTIGGVGYVQSIGNIEASPENFQTYVDIILESSAKYQAYRALKRHIDNIKGNAKDGKTSKELISSVEADMLDMSSLSMLSEDPIRFGDTLDEYLDERKDTKIGMTGISTGYPVLDRQIDGMIPGTLMIIAARKKMGKSAFLTNIAIHNAIRAQVPTLYIDTELTFLEWQTRALARISGIKERDIKHGGYTDEQQIKLNNAKMVIKDKKLFHKYMPGYSVEKVVSLCKKYKLKEDVGLIVFDYLKEPDLSTNNDNRKEYQLLGDITTKLKDLAGTLDIPVLTAVQLNRQNNIADSDRIARFGDIVAIWGARTEEEQKETGEGAGDYKLHIKDTRRGGSTQKGGIGFRFFKTRLDIREINPADQYYINYSEKVSVDDFDDEAYEQMVGDELA